MSRILLLFAVLCLSFPAQSTEPDKVTAAEAADNEALKSIFEADQSDRTSGALQRDAAAVMARDQARRDQTLEMVRAGRLRTARDYFHAAMVFQHSQEDIRLAHALSTIASYLDRENKQYRWLVAASWDRMLMQQKQPQWYGTQYQGSDAGLYLYPVAEDAVDDADRERMGVPTLAQARARTAEMAAMMGTNARAVAPSIEDLRREQAPDAARPEAKPKPE